MTISLHLLDRKLVNTIWADSFQKNLLNKLINLSMEEDLGLSQSDDLTTAALVDANLQVEAKIYCKEDDVLIAGLALIEEVFKRLDPLVNTNFLVADGDRIVSSPKVIASVSGTACAILGAERIVLNLLQRLSGIATLTQKFVERAKPYGIDILDTRKTTPGLRVFERYAVVVGGGVNHRFSLSDKILVKDNHIQIAGNVSKAVATIRQSYPQQSIEVECVTLSQVEECLANNVEKIMLDNMTPNMVRKAVTLINGRSYIEVSGGINLANIDDYLLPGVNGISIGALTHSAKNVDLSLEVEKYL